MKKIKVLLAKLGLDVHNRGIAIVGKGLMASGMEIIYVGNSLPQEIITTSIHEDVDVIGVSSLVGAHLTLGKSLIDLANKENVLNNMVFLIGGVFPPDDGLRLKDIGYDAVFTPGATIEEITISINHLVKRKTFF